MMKFIALACLLFAVALAVPAPAPVEEQKLPESAPAQYFADDSLIAIEPEVLEGAEQRYGGYGGYGRGYGGYGRGYGGYGGYGGRGFGGYGGYGRGGYGYYG